MGGYNNASRSPGTKNRGLVKIHATDSREYKMKSSSFKLRILSYLSAIALLVANSPLALAAEEEEAAGDPVWVLSYASFLLFAAVTVFLCVFFSRRRETALDAAELKKVGQIRNARIKERRKAEQYARVHGQKK